MECDQVLQAVESFQTLGEVIRWALARTPRAEFVSVIVQDEYTHDVVVRVTPQVFAVFGTT